MKKVRKYRKLLSSLLIFTLILSMGSGVFAAKSAGAFAKEADQYKIYPIPQSVTYGNSSFIMSEDVNVVAEEGIDKGCFASMQLWERRTAVRLGRLGRLSAGAASAPGNRGGNAPAGRKNPDRGF